MKDRPVQPRVTRVLPAGPAAQVVTVVGGGDAYVRSPCAECPWRVDQAGTFPAKAFRHSANTAYDMATETFGCHMTGTTSPATCAGFLLRGSAHNLSIRLRLINGQIKVDDVTDGGHALHKSYRAMAVANGVSQRAVVLRQCRSNEG